MAQHTYNANFIHCVFSTKNRRNTIPAELQDSLWAYMLGIANRLKVKTIAIGGTENHVHLLLGLPSTMTVAEAVQKLKANSSRWMGEHGIPFQWQEGYGAFSVSPSLLEVVQQYIRNQKEHHCKRGFEQELRAILEKSGVAYDAEKLFVS
jgi:putative transposase